LQYQRAHAQRHARQSLWRELEQSRLRVPWLRRCVADFHPEAAELISKVTGWDCSGAEPRRIGERISYGQKPLPKNSSMSAKAGNSPTTGNPRRLLSEILPNGIGTGTGLSLQELRQMIRSYYPARGWDENGLVPKAN
jgi:aldehyde:ferredoxin oxidoreductase